MLPKTAKSRAKPPREEVTALLMGLSKLHMFYTDLCSLKNSGTPDTRLSSAALGRFFGEKGIVEVWGNFYLG